MDEGIEWPEITVEYIVWASEFETVEYDQV